MTNNKITINRAPVLTLWAAVVAERLGYDRETALTLAKAVTGLNAQSKGQKLGIFEKKSSDGDEKESAAEPKFIELLGREIPVVKTPEGLRAAIKGEKVDAESVETYLQHKFKDDLEEARAAMEKLARAYSREHLEFKAYGLYEKFRPGVPEGKQGWGVKGELDLDYIRSLAR
jgi:hypothetical protein